jgi:hypothetical protein
MDLPAKNWHSSRVRAPPGIAHKCTRVFPLRSQPHLRPPQLSCMSSMFLIAPQVEISQTTHYYPGMVVFSYPIYRSQKIAHHPCTVAARDEPGARLRAASAVPSYIKCSVPASSVFACAPLDVFVFGVWVDLRITWSQVPLPLFFFFFTSFYHLPYFT